MDSKWVRGHVKDYQFEAKVNESKTLNGINGGKVSQLIIRNKFGVIVDYNEKWNTRPTKTLLSYFNDVMTRIENGVKYT